MLANAPPQGKGCGPPGPNPFPHRSLMHRRNASPHRFLVRRSKPLQSAFPFPQEEHKTLTIPPARETQNCAGNAELRKKRGIARETQNCVLRKTESEHGNRSKERSVLKKDRFEHGDK